MIESLLFQGPAGALLGRLLANGAIAAVLMVFLFWLGRKSRRPELMHVLWLLVWLKLLTPAWLTFRIPWPASAGTGADAGLSAEQLAMLAAGQTSVPIQSWWSGLEAQLMLSLWCFGVVTAVALSCIRHQRWRGLISQGRPAPADLEEKTQRLSEQLGLAEAPELRLLDAPISPAVTARLIGRGLLVLPAELIQQLDEDGLEAVIAHELAHLKRRDPWIRRLEMVVGFLYWWHPLVHWGKRRLRHWEEQCCDLTVLRALPQHRRAYAQALISTLEHVHIRPQSLPAGVHCLGSGRAGHHDLKERLHMIIRSDRHSSKAPSVRWVLALGLVLLPWTPMIGADEPAAIDQSADTSLAPSLEESLNDRPKMSSSNSSIDLPTDKSYTGSPISMSLSKADLRKVLTSFGEISSLEVKMHPSVQGSVTVELKGGPWDQALDGILQVHGLRLKIEDGVIYIDPKATND